MPNGTAFVDQNRNGQLDVSGTIDESQSVIGDPNSLGEVNWNQYNGFVDAQGNKHSPAMIFLHELRHAVHYMENPGEFIKRTRTLDTRYDNKEEKLTVIEINEISGSCGNGDGGDGCNKIRTDHGASQVGGKVESFGAGPDVTKH